MTNHTQHQQEHQWQPAPPTHHDNGQWKGHDGYKDAHGNTYDSGHWKGHDAYPPYHNNQHDHHHHQGHQWQSAPVRDTNGNPVQPGESTILPIQDPRAVPDHQHQWHPAPQSAQPMRDEQGNVLQPGEFATLPVPDQLGGQQAWQQDLASVDTLAAAPAPSADGLNFSEAAASGVSWEPVQGSFEMGQGGTEFSIMPITMT